MHNYSIKGVCTEPSDYFWLCPHQGLQILADPGASWTSGAAALIAVETYLCQPASLLLSQAWVADFSPSVLTFGLLMAVVVICILILRSFNASSSMIHAKTIRDRRRTVT